MKKIALCLFLLSTTNLFAQQNLQDQNKVEKDILTMSVLQVANTQCLDGITLEERKASVETVGLTLGYLISKGTPEEKVKVLFEKYQKETENKLKTGNKEAFCKAMIPGIKQFSSNPKLIEARLILKQELSKKKEGK